MPQARLTCEVTFHGPVRVGSGRAGRGLDDTVDPGVVVPGSSLKGLMRAEATMLFPHQEDLIKAVFGTPRGPSPWHWGDIRAAADDPLHTGARIRVDSDAATTVDSGLFLADYHWPTTASFHITQFVAVDPAHVPRHRALLAAAAMSVTSIGGDRNRGFGWVDIRTDADLDGIAALVGATA